MLPLFGADTDTVTGIGIGGGLAVVLNFAHKIWSRKQDSEDKREEQTQASSREMILRLSGEVEELKKKDLAKDITIRELVEESHRCQLRDTANSIRIGYLEDILTEKGIWFPKTSGLSPHEPIAKGEPK